MMETYAVDAAIHKVSLLDWDSSLMTLQDVQTHRLGRVSSEA
jgi:hypothetical protein